MLQNEFLIMMSFFRERPICRGEKVPVAEERLEFSALFRREQSDPACKILLSMVRIVIHRVNEKSIAVFNTRNGFPFISQLNEEFTPGVLFALIRSPPQRRLAIPPPVAYTLGTHIGA